MNQKLLESIKIMEMDKEGNIKRVVGICKAKDFRRIK